METPTAHFSTQSSTLHLKLFSQDSLAVQGILLMQPPTSCCVLLSSFFHFLQPEVRCRKRPSNRLQIIAAIAFKGG